MCVEFLGLDKNIKSSVQKSQVLLQKHLSLSEPHSFKREVLDFYPGPITDFQLRFCRSITNLIKPVQNLEILIIS